ncbi:MAG: restriction endonuclease, partial [Spirochaetota bacterium]|nr:restriction endonuclease [Spirochaetota bacterium]
AIKILVKGLEELPNNEDSLSYRYLLANCYELENSIKDALYHWEKIVAIKSDFRDTQIKINEYKSIIENENLNYIFSSTMDELQPLLAEIIARLNFNIISKTELNKNIYLYKAFNIKRTNEPPTLIYFHRTTRDITAVQISDFIERAQNEKCKNNIYITTSDFDVKAVNTAMIGNIELINLKALDEIIDKVKE